VGKILFALALGFFVAEMGGRLFWRLKTKSWFDSGVAWAGNNAFAAQIGGTLAGYTATLAAHPYLAHVHKAGPGINRQGLFGRDFPQARDPRVYQVLVTGGSVACQLAGIRPEQGALTVELEKNYISADGRPIRVYNGADGAWKLPQQTILTMMYAGRFDLVISVDGFNEHYVVKGDPYFLEVPSPNFRTVSPVGFHAKPALIALWFAGQFNEALAGIPGIRELFVSHLIGQSALNLARAFDEKTKPKTTPLMPLEYPPGETLESQRQQRQKQQLSQLETYLELNDAICRQQGAQYVSVLQPCPAIGKELTEREKQVVGPLDYRGSYLKMAETYKKASNKSRFLCLNLLEVFSGVKADVYKDHIHCAPGPNSPGYLAVAKSLGGSLKENNLIKKSKSRR
jgi:hypothetical protein